MDYIAGKRVAVVAWDLSTNTVGRAFALAEMLSQRAKVEIVGPIFGSGNHEIWLPIRNSEIPIHVIRCSGTQAFFERSTQFAAKNRYDVVIVSKPRFPSICLGLLIRHFSEACIILDIDEDELSFFPESSFKEPSFDKSALFKGSEWSTPYSYWWTRFAAELIPSFDSIIVSNVALQRLYDAPIIRHSRDEKRFNPRLFNRNSVRQQLRISIDDKVVLFLGTPRAHKGLQLVANALESLRDSNILLVVIGSANPDTFSREFDQLKSVRLSVHGEVAWERLPELTCIADTVCLMQDPACRITKYQIPAKLTDALALGVPIVCSDVPPLRDLVELGVVFPATPQSLSETIRHALQQSGNLKYVRRARAVFLQEFSHRVNGGRLEAVIEDATNRDKGAVEADAALTRIEEVMGAELFARHLGATCDAFNPPPKTDLTLPAVDRDIVVFWKGNDSDLYGRRHDCMTRALSMHESIKRVVHFDKPIFVDELLNLLRDRSANTQSRHVASRIIQRHLGVMDEDNIFKRSFIFRKEHGTQTLFGQPLPLEYKYAMFVSRELQLIGVGEEAIAWVYPPNNYFTQIAKLIRFSRVVADIVDDDRCWATSEKRRAAITKNYEKLLLNATLTIANCESVKEALQYASKGEIVVIPNGIDPTHSAGTEASTNVLRGIPRPIIGYVGNLRDRIDVDLIRQSALERTDWSFVFIGSMHGVAPVRILEDLPNVYFLGVVPYPASNALVKAFDVAIIPHLRCEMTDNMNPLKQYIYEWLQVPTVSADIANLDSATDATIVSNVSEFVRKIDACLNREAGAAKRGVREDRHLWSQKVSYILSQL